MTFGGIGDPREAMHTFWFHDHRAAFTANNNYLGLNGMYIVYDSKDPAHELATPGSLRLPGYYGVTDIPLILTDKRFCAAANGRNEVFQVVGSGAPRRRQVDRQRQDPAEVDGAPAQVPFPHPQHRPGQDLEPEPRSARDGTQAPMTIVAVDANFLAVAGRR